ncbi:MAG TPA: PAS domain S-box protein [Tepidiformaceae bacterium]|nr:PAS domain S-box protein [Tepidiformaceae bacterium]
MKRGAAPQLAIHKDLVARLQSLDAGWTGEDYDSLAAYLVSLVDRSGSGMLVVDPNGGLLLANRSLSELLGRSEQELQRLTVRDVTHPDDLAESERLVARAFAFGEGFTLEKRYIRADGAIVWARTMISPLLGSDGKPHVLLALVQDASAERQARDVTERRERRYRALVEATGGVVWAAQADGQGAALGRDWQNFTGQSPEEAAGYGWFRRVHPEDRDIVRAAWTQAVADRLPVNFQYRVMRRDGAYRRMFARGVPVFDDNGELLEVVGTSTDIEDAERAEAERATTAAMMDALLANSPIGIALLDAEGRYIRINPALAEANGRSVEEHIGRHWWELFPALREKHGPLIQHVMESGEAVRDQEMSNPDPSQPDNLRHWLVNYFPVPGPDRQAAVGITAIDISPRVRAREALSESQARLRALLEATPAMVVSTDPEGVVQFVSKEWSDFTGLEAAETRNWEQQDLVHPDDVDRTERTRREGLRSGQGYDLDYRLRRKDGRYRWLSASVRPARSQDGRLVGWTYVGLDVHDRVTAREHLERLNADLRLLADSVPALVLTAPAGGIPSFANRQWREFTGLDLEEIAADWPETELVHPDDIQALRTGWTAALEHGQPQELEFRLRRADGEYRWLTWRAQPLRDREGRRLGWIAAGIDVQDQVHLRQEVQRANEQLRILADAGHAMAGAADFDTGVEAAARVLVPAAADWCSIDIQDGDRIIRKIGAHSTAIPDDVAEVLRRHPPSLDQPDDPFTNILLSGRSLFEPEAQHTTVFIRSDEHARAVHSAPPGSAIAVPLRSGGRIFGVMALVRVDSRPRFTEADHATALELGARFGALLDRARLFSQVTRALGHLRLLADAGLVLSRAGELQEAIDAAAHVVVPAYADWCTVDLLEGNRIRRATLVADQRVDPEAAEVVRNTEVRLGDQRDFVARTIETGEPFFVPQMPEGSALNRDHGPEYREAVAKVGATSAIAVPLRTGDRVFGVLGLARTAGRDPYAESDLALALELGRQLGGWIERSRLFSELRQALAAKDEFFGFVSHELKTPLTTVVGLSDVLARRVDTLSEEERADAVSLLRRDSLRLEEIIANMLTLARSERTTGDEPVLVHRVITDAVALHRQRNPLRPIETRIEGGLSPVLAPGGWIDRVLENLLSNAEKYSSDDETPIEIEAMQDDSSILVRVLDRGRGISPQQMREVFQPFFRADPNEPGVPGVGLGLTVCRRLIERLGGQVWLVSRDGGGIEAGFRVPAMDIPEE